LPKSIARQIVISLTITTILAVVCEYGWLYLKARSTAAVLRERSLIDQASDISRHIVSGTGGNLDLVLPARLAESYSDSNSPYRYVVRNEYGNAIFTSGPSIAPLPPMGDHQDKVYQYDPDGSGPLYVFGAAVKTHVGGRELVTQVEQVTIGSQFLNSSVIDEFITDGGWLQLPFLLLLLGVSVVVVKRALRPLSRISEVAKRVDPAKANVRLPTEDVPNEIKPLVSAMNIALDRLDDGLQSQREFSANAAHQLRTPLAVLTANIDGMSDKVTAAKLRPDIESMNRTIAQLLRLARLETLVLGSGGQSVDLNIVATEVATNLGPLAIASGKHLEVVTRPEPVFAFGNVQALEPAVSNLIENAITHTSKGTTITVQVTSDLGIDVIDTGAGIPSDWRDKIFDRFWKGDRNSIGAGLGLAIVKRSVAALDGTVMVSENPTGGSIFKLRFVSPNSADRGSRTGRRRTEVYSPSIKPTN